MEIKLHCFERNIRSLPLMSSYIWGWLPVVVGSSFDGTLFFLKIFIYLFMRDTERGSRDTGRGRCRLHAGSPMWDLILGIQDHALG